MAGLWIVVVVVLLIVGYCLLVGLGAIQFGLGWLWCLGYDCCLVFAYRVAGIACIY